MKHVTLSGGNYGGSVIDWSDVTRHVAMVDASGDHWVYDVALNADSDIRADFIGIIKLDDLPAACEIIAAGTL